MANELARWRAGVMGLFWLWRKLRSRERKWLLCLCVFLYIDSHRLPHSSEPLEPSNPGVSWLWASCRTEGGVTEGTGGAKRPAVRKALGIMWLLLCSFTPASQK